MQNEKGLPRCNGNSPSEKKSIPSVAVNPDFVNSLAAICQTASGKQVVDAVRVRHPGFDKQLLSKCRHHERYGIGILSDSMDDLCRIFGFEAVATPLQATGAVGVGKHPPENRRMKQRLSCRLDDATAAQVITRRIKDGYTNTRDFLYDLCKRYGSGYIRMNDVPDHPVIRNMERSGYPDGNEPDTPICPVCEEGCSKVYKDRFGEIVGCDECLKAYDADDEPQCFPGRGDE